MTALIDARLGLHVRVSDDAELPLFFEAAQQLVDWLTLAAGKPVEVTVTFGDSMVAGIAGQPVHVELVSMLDAVSETSDDFEAIEARWQAELRSFRSRSDDPLFICTVFRHVPDGDARRRTLERIRRVDLMIAGLSHAHGVGVIDLDRTLAHFGARALRTDYRLGGPIAAKVAGEVIVDALLAEGLDEVLDAELLTRVRALRGERAQSFRRIEAAIASAREVRVALA